jgi:hypothetical protein
MFEKKHPSASTTVYLNELYNEVQNAYNLFLAESRITCVETMQPTTGSTIYNFATYVKNKAVRGMSFFKRKRFR